jgi:hypothetical protein
VKAWSVSDTKHNIVIPVQAEHEAESRNANPEI